MQRWARMRVIAGVVLVMASVAIGSLADLRSSSAAMACCAKTHNRCAGLSQPDDCCKRMGHGAASVVASTPSDAHQLALPAAGLVDFLLVTRPSARQSSNAELAFKRPHDPPHLHPFSLLI